MKLKKNNCINIFVLLFLTVFPLFFDNYYINITITKYKVFSVLSLSIFFTGLYYTLSANIEQNRTLKIDSLSSYLRRMSLCDILFLLLLITAVLSCLMSEWRLPALSGVCGKYTGLIFMLLTGGLYYGITRHMTLIPYIKYSFPVILSMISLMAFFQFCGYDVLGFYKGIADGTMYIATFGHVDVFSAFLCVYLPVCLYLFCYTDGRENLLYATGCFMGFLAIFSSNSDSSYIGLGISLAVLLILAVSNTDRLKRYATLILLLTSAAVLWKIFPPLFGLVLREQSSITTFFTSAKILCISALTGGFLFLLCIFINKQKKNLPKCLPCILTAFFMVLIFLLIISFIWFSFFDTKKDLGELENYLRFNSHWGSDRGYVWKWLIQFFGFSSLLTKLFGAGPDTTTLILYKYFKVEMSDELGVFYASAHNEYLNYLVTIGLVGTILYLAILILSIIKCFRKRRTNAFFGAVGLAILAYSCMAAVNISQPITMPFIYLLIAFANQKN